MVTLREIFRDRGKAAALFPVLFMGWLVPFCSVSFHLAFPTITRQLGISTVHTAWIPTAYLIAGAVFGLPIGRLTNRIGARNAFAASLSTYLAGSAFVALSGSFRMLAASFFGMGAGSTMVIVTGRAIMYNTCTQEERTRLIGVLITLISLGTLAGNFLGGVVIHFIHWRGIYWTGAAGTLYCLFLVLRKVPRGDGDPSHRALDIVGVMLYTVFIVTFLIGFSNFPHETSLFLVPFALVMLAAFVWYESRSPAPILHVRLFRENPTFRFAALSITLQQFSTYGIWFLMSFYLQHVNRLSAAEAGIILGLNAGVTAGLSSIAHWLKEHLGISFMIISGLVLYTASLAVLALMLADFSLLRILAVMLMLGIANGMTVNTIPGLMVGRVDPEHRTMASATLNLARKMGSSMSMGTVMLFVSVLLGKAQLDGVQGADFLVCMRAVLLVFMFLSAVPLTYATIHYWRKFRGRGTAPAA